MIPFLCSASGRVDSTWTSRPNTWTWRPNTSRNEPSWEGEPPPPYNNNKDPAPNNESLVNQSWLLNAPRTQATTRRNQSDSYLEQDNDEEDYGDLPNVDDEDYTYATQSWSVPPPSYDTVRKPESLWQPYSLQQYNHEVETIEELRHLGTFGMKPPYRFGTHEDDPLATEYIKLDPQVLSIASSAIAGQ